MPTAWVPFPDAERAVADVLAALGNVGTETGADLQQKVPYILVRRVGGVDNRITDAARIDVLVHAADRTTAKSIAEQARQLLLTGRRATPHGILDHAVTEVGPQVLPVVDTDGLRMAQATYRISMRR